MKKILFLCTDHFGLYKIFEEGIQKYTDAQVTTILYKKFRYDLYRNFRYKNLRQKITNFFSKTFLNENLKPFYASQANIEHLTNSDHFDIVFVICPDFLHVRTLQFLKTISKKTIVYYWDGFDHFPRYKESLPYFDERYSFDPVDVKKYNLKFITNFYFQEDRNTETKTDLFFLSSYDSRFPLIEKIASLLEKQNKKVLIFQHTIHKDIIEKYKDSSIKFIDKFIPFKETTEYIRDTRIVLDIHKEIQHGLSFR
ncbi:MAG TPA: hypothetical protein VGB43_00355, partial [Flavobacterium sp.]